MPYKIEKVDGGEKVKNTETGKYASSRPLPHDIAVKQFNLLEGIENGWTPTGTPANRDKKD